MQLVQCAFAAILCGVHECICGENFHSSLFSLACGGVDILGGWVYYVNGIMLNRKYNDSKLKEIDQSLLN